MVTFSVILVLLVFGAGLFLLNILARKYVKFNKRVMIGLVLGLLLGSAIQLIFGVGSEVITVANDWITLVGNGYVRLLRMIVFPLILVSILYAIISQNSKNLGKMSIMIVAVLMITTAISAVVGGVSAVVFNLDPVAIEMGDAELNRADFLEVRLDDWDTMPIQQRLLNIIPINPFEALTGQGSAPTISVVLFATILGLAVLGVRKKNPEATVPFEQMVNSCKDIVMRMVTMVLRLAPYGVFALITRFMSVSSFAGIASLGRYVVASYVAMFVVFIIHGVILFFFKINPFIFFKKAMPPFIFGFSSQTSAGTLPLTTKTLTKTMGVKEGYANLSATLGTTIGQNGCAGVYPAMLAFMIAPTVGINPFEPTFFITLIIVTAISSIGIGGVGGGATFAALAVLSAMNLPVALVAILISVEPLIGMLRTSLNISGAMLSGLISARLDKAIDMEVYNNKELIASTE